MKCMAALFLTIYSSLVFATNVSITNAYIPLMPPATKTYAAYLTINNSSERSRTLVGISADDFAMAHLHKSMIKDDVASMESMKELNVPAGESLTMLPGGMHVMLMKPGRAFNEGDTVVLKLMFADGEVATVEAKIGMFN